MWRVSFLSVLCGTAVVAFLSQAIEHRAMKLAGALALATVVGTVFSVALAISGFKTISALDVVLRSCCLAGLPLLASWLLSLNGTQGNFHGSAILGYLVYVFGSQLCAFGLLIAQAVRTAVRLKKRYSV